MLEGPLNPLNQVLSQKGTMNPFLVSRISPLNLNSVPNKHDSGDNVSSSKCNKHIEGAAFILSMREPAGQIL
jgi:hypothetical protein